MKRTRVKLWFLRTFAGVLALTAVLCLGMGAFLPCAQAADVRTVRIPYGFNDLLQIDDSGHAVGYYAEYLLKLAEINRWKYEYVKATWSEAVEMLQNGKIDFLFPVNHSDQRDETMEFSSMPIGYTAAGIFALEESRFHYDHFSSFNDMRICLVEGSSNEAALAAYAQENHFTYQPVYRDSNSEIMAALKNGEADLAVFSAANDFPEGVLVSVMDAQPVYFAVKEENSELLFQLDQAMQAVMKSDPQLLADVIRKTMIGENASYVALTEEEQAFVQSGTQITVGFYEETEPLAYVREDGTYAGLYIELLEYLKERSGLNLVLYPISRDQNWKTLVSTGEIDFYVGSSNVIVSQDDDLRTTDPFLNYSNILSTRNNCAFNKLETPVIALTYARANWANYLRSYMDRDFEIRYYHTAKECLMAVIKGEAHASLLNNLEFNYQSKNERLSSLILWPQYRFSTDVSFAASDQVDEVMFSAFNKAVLMLDSDYVNAKTEDCLNIPYHSYSAEDMLYNARFPLSVVGITLLALAGIAVFYFRQKRVEEEAREKERQQLQILAATSYDHAAIYYIDLDEDKSRAVSQHAGLEKKDKPNAGTVRSYSQALRSFAQRYVLPEYQESILSCADKETVLARFGDDRQFSVRYQIRPDAREQTNFEMKFIRVDDDPQGHRMMVMGIRCVDDIVREEKMQRQLLQEALDGANRANAAKSEFFSRVSHDIRTPLNAIIGMTAIAAMHAEEPSRVRDALSKIIGASRHLLSLINDVLDMSKIETGKMNLNEEEFALSELIGNLLTIIRPQAREHHHRLRVDIRDMQHEAVIGDSMRLQQVLLNLMGNSVKYTPDGGEIQLIVREIPINTTNAGCYEFVISDNGIGMSQEYLKHIFEPFSRAEDQRTSKIQGTGLGMSITRNIVHMMNGDIDVQSELGKGSTFTVTIFLKFQSGEDAVTSEAEDLAVLVVDDDAEICHSICGMLERIGVKGVACSSGIRAVEMVKDSLAQGDPFYAVILDWKMPDIDGMEAAGAIRQLRGEGGPIIVLSAYDIPEIEEEARNAGVDTFINKPVFRSDIVRLFKTLKSDKKDEIYSTTVLERLQESNFIGRRVLLVEDNDLNREIAKEILEIGNVTVEEAENGQLAVERFAASEPGYYDMIMMDVQMPVMNGYEACKAIRALDRADAAGVPIVAMTANAFVEDIQAARSAGMNDHLAKPLDFEKLNTLLHKYLG